jgi:hypothetical protein
MPRGSAIRRVAIRLRSIVPIVLGIGALAVGARAAAKEERPEAVLLLHGLARSDGSMGLLGARLAEAGFEVHNLDYPSTDHAPEELDALLFGPVHACCSAAPRVHFVTHSLGGILLRAHLARHRPPNLGRVVMLAPPNRGSEWVDLLGRSPAFRWALGPTAAQLGTDVESLPNRLPPVDFPLGVIAGTRSINPLGSAILPEPNDGTVSVESTRVEGMSDFLTVEASHTFIMRSEEVARQVIAFLRSGRFERPEDHSP